MEDKKNTSDVVTETDVKVGARRACMQLLRQDTYTHTHTHTHIHTPTHAHIYTHMHPQSEEIVFSRIRSAFPDHLLIGEESSASASNSDRLTDAPTWMCGKSTPASCNCLCVLLSSYCAWIVLEEDLRLRVSNLGFDANVSLVEVLSIGRRFFV